MADCPDRDAHVRSAVQAERVARELDDLQRQVRGRTESLARRFDRVLRLLEAWGYLDGWALTDVGRGAGPHLPRVRPARRRGDDQRAARRPRRPVAGRAGVVLHLRAPRPRPAARPAVPVLDRARRGSSSCAGSPTTWPPTRRTAGLPATRRPTPGFVHLAHAWAAGEGLAAVLEDEELSGGDFVRNVKQLIDLLRGIGDVAPVPATAARARQAADALHRGVVTASSAARGRRGGRGAALTIRRVRPGASRARCPAHGVVVRSDAEARAIVTAARRAGEPIPPLGLLGGDLCRTLGGTGDEARLRSDAAVQLPVDLGAVLVDGRLHWFVAHLVARRGWWRGRVVAAMNAQFLGDWDVAPRGHPNDGRLDVLRRRPALRRAPPGPRPAEARHPRAPPAHRRAPPSRRAARPRAADARLPRRRRLDPAKKLSIRVEPDALLCVV